MPKKPNTPERYTANCDDCKTSGGSKECAIIGRLAASGMHEQAVEISAALLSVGEEPQMRADFMPETPPGIKPSTHLQRFHAVTRRFREVPILSGVVSTVGDKSRRQYHVDSVAKKRACEAIAADPDLVPDFPTAYKAKTRAESSPADKELVDSACKTLIAWMLRGTDAERLAELLKRCKPLQIATIITRAKKEVLYNSNYEGSVEIQQRFALVSRTPSDERGGANKAKLLSLFVSEEPSEVDGPDAGTDISKRPVGGLCKGTDPDLFYPERGESTRRAKEVCRDCAVREPCLETGLEGGEKFGIWGGLSERERRRIRRQRAQARRAAEAAQTEVALAD